jgi:hypothetical protein
MRCLVRSMGGKDGTCRTEAGAQKNISGAYKLVRCLFGAWARVCSRVNSCPRPAWLACLRFHMPDTRGNAAANRFTHHIHLNMA